MSGGYRIEKLTESNYSTWKVEAHSLLVDKEQWAGVADPATLKPEQLAPGGLVDRALATIRLSISKSQYPVIAHAKSAWEAWNMLKRVHESSNEARVIDLLGQYGRLALEPRESLQTYFAGAATLRAALEGCGEVKTDAAHKRQILSGLPPSKYGPVIDSERLHVGD
jgi:hypothetical protein